METVTLYNWTSVDTNFLNDTLDSLICNADKQSTNIKRVFGESIGGDLDFKLQMDESTLYLANGVLYNRNEAGNFTWAYYLEAKNISGYTAGILAQGGSLISPILNKSGSPRFDESWDRKARWAGVEYYYTRNNQHWAYDFRYGGKILP